MAYIYNGVLLNYLKAGNPAICNSMDGLWGHYAKWNKSDKDKYCIILLIGTILKKKTQNMWSDLWLSEAGNRWRGNWIKVVKTYKFPVKR